MKRYEEELHPRALAWYLPHSVSTPLPTPVPHPLHPGWLPNSPLVFVYNNFLFSLKPFYQITKPGIDCMVGVGTLELIFYFYNLLYQTKASVTGTFRCLNDVIKIVFPTCPLRLCLSLSFFFFLFLHVT